MLMMSSCMKLSSVAIDELSDTYHSLYDLQHRLGINEQHLLNTTKCRKDDKVDRENLTKLLKASKIARDHLVTWHLKYTLVELNVTISLMTAKIKFIEYKLGLCDGLDLHQACKLSLVDFCNILSDMVTVNPNASERKTMKQVSRDLGIPVWLSHYRNQICHVPSEGPCISILVPLVSKALDFMKASFWSKVLKYETFDESKFKKYMDYISKLTYVTSMNKRLRLRKNNDLSKKRAEVAEKNLAKYSKICLNFRKMIVHNPDKTINILAGYISTYRFDDKTRNTALLLEQIIFAKQFEQFVFKIAMLVRQNQQCCARMSWLKRLIHLISERKLLKLKSNLKDFELSASPQIKRLTDVPALKCCQLAYFLSRLESPHAKKLIITLRYKLLPILGREKTVILVKMTQLVNK